MYSQAIKSITLSPYQSKYNIVHQDEARFKLVVLANDKEYVIVESNQPTKGKSDLYHYDIKETQYIFDEAINLEAMKFRLWIFYYQDSPYKLEHSLRSDMIDKEGNIRIRLDEMTLWSTTNSLDFIFHIHGDKKMIKSNH